MQFCIERQLYFYVAANFFFPLIKILALLKIEFTLFSGPNTKKIVALVPRTVCCYFSDSTAPSLSREADTHLAT
jgi:hypothetical protein